VTTIDFSGRDERIAAWVTALQATPPLPGSASTGCSTIRSKVRSRHLSKHPPTATEIVYMNDNQRRSFPAIADYLERKFLTKEKS